jgi:ferredoxin-NADP reductase
MARAAVLGGLNRRRLTWLVADVVSLVAETATARTLVLDVPGWLGHVAGQHVDIRLTAPDGYSVQRSYSIATAPAGIRIELTVQRIAGGEVSSYLVDEARVGDQIELRGPVGGYFVWLPEWTDRVLLLGGGSGVVPLMAMLRSRDAAGAFTPTRLIYSARTADDLLYAGELRERAANDPQLKVTYAFTREAPAAGQAPPGWSGRVSRVDDQLLARAGWEPDLEPFCYVCGPTAFVEVMAGLLVDAGHSPSRVRTERFG